ncbi:MAG: hypothetical protein LBP40_08245 [Campylobacteraceae bacterium]|jgi:prefoldin subunit 5|nr:hypothetical protein [Campylobacteraceae bacterium]
MTRAELAELIGKDVSTLNNWEKNNPELIRLINQGLMLEEQIEELEEYIKKLKNMKQEANSGKLKLKKLKER